MLTTHLGEIAIVQHKNVQMCYEHFGNVINIRLLYICHDKADEQRNEKTQNEDREEKNK